MRRYIIAAGLAASEVGGLMIVWSAIGLFTGAKSRNVLPDIVALAGTAGWLWWRRSLVAAGLMFALVALEYWYLAYNSITSGKSNSWLSTYAILFIIAFFAHAKDRKEVPATIEGVTRVPDALADFWAACGAGRRGSEI